MKIKDKMVLVTGADGFIGSHLVEALVQAGAGVRALAHYNSFNFWGWLQEIEDSEKIEIVTGDIRDPHYCDLITKGVDVIFNLASLIAIPYSYTAPGSYVDTNIKGALNICQSARHYKVKEIVQISTSEVYGTALYVPIDEKHPLQPQSPYSASKIGADMIAMSFYNAFNLPVTIARPFNTYGPRQSARAVIPTIITQIVSGKKEISLGDITPTRDFTYVLDTCRGLIALSECDDCIGEVVNIGSNFEISIEGIFNTVKKITGSNARIAVDKERIRPEKSEVRRLCCNNNKMQRLTGFKPQYALEEGLRLTVEWFKDPANLKKYNTYIYNI